MRSGVSATRSSSIPTARPSTSSRRSEPRRGGRRARRRSAAVGHASAGCRRAHRRDDVRRGGVPPVLGRAVAERARARAARLGARARRTHGARARVRARPAVARGVAARRRRSCHRLGRRRDELLRRTPSGTTLCSASRASAGAIPSRCCARRRGISSSAPTSSTRSATPTSSPLFSRGSAARCSSPSRAGRTRRTSSQRFHAEPVAERIYRLAC